MKKYAVIVAGGSGSRMGGGIPKQFRSLCSHPVLWWSMKAFKDEDPETQIILVLPEDFISLWNDFFNTLPPVEKFEHKITAGGNSRSESVKNGLLLIDDLDSLVAVHDGARPLVKTEIIRRGWEKAKEFKAAIPVVPVVDSLREVTDNGNFACDRTRFRSVQTPQVFETSLLSEAYEKVGNRVFSDDASVVEAFGNKIVLFDGDPNNIKITNPFDMTMAEALLNKNA